MNIMNISSVLARNFNLNGNYLINICKESQILKGVGVINANVLIPPQDIHFYNSNNKYFGNILPSLKEINTPNNSIRIDLPEFIRNINYENPLKNHNIVTSIGTTINPYVDQVTHEQYLFNKLRNDTKHRKRAFVKRGYFRRSRCLNRKLNRLSYAYALQGIDYEMIENLEMGEIPDLKDYFK